MKKSYIATSLASFMAFNIMTSCLSYSFTGGSVPINVKTFSVNNITNRAPLVEPNLAFNLSEQLKTLILNNTNLTLVDAEADVSFTGYIAVYDITPIAVISSDSGGGAQQNRLTVTVNITYVDDKNSKNSFKEQFSAYQDFLATQSLISIKEELLANIIEQITQNIYNRAFANW